MPEPAARVNARERALAPALIPCPLAGGLLPQAAEGPADEVEAGLDLTRL